MKRGGQVIYTGPLGHHSSQLIEYFQVSIPCNFRYGTYSTQHWIVLHTTIKLPLPSCQVRSNPCYLVLLGTKRALFFQSIPGVPKLKKGHNPATWMLEISTPAVEAQLDIDFTEIYVNSDLYR